MTRAGGNATAAGAEFQAAATAWYCVSVLAEQEVPPPFDLPASATLEVVYCETSEPVDDILIGTAGDGFIFVQCKHSLSLSSSDDSELASVIDQFVRQFVANRATTTADPPWQRPLDPNRDRLVAIVGPKTPDTVVRDVPTLLTKVRGLAGRPLEDAPTNAGETKTLSILRTHISTAWRKAMGVDPSANEVRDLLCLMRVEVLDFDDGATTTQRARTVLRSSILAVPTMDTVAWDHLVARAIGLAKNRTGVDRSALRSMLTAAEIRLQAPSSYTTDIERLRKYTEASLELMRPLSEITFGRTKLKITRECSAVLWDGCQRESLLVTGDPGAGKSGVLHGIAARASSDHVDCVLLLADRISAHSLERLQADLGLTHPLVDVLSAWSAPEPGLLIIDALDAAREENAARTIRDLLQLVGSSASRWRIVASIRKFDLRYGEQFRRHFLGTPLSPAFADSEFNSVRHLNVPQLSADELSQIAADAPALASLVADAPPALHDLLLQPFNLRLAADLLSHGVVAADINPYRTRLELLDRYWAERIIGSGAGGDARETLLRRACEAMLTHRTMQVERAELAGSQPDALAGLLSNHVLTEWRSPTGKVDRYLLSYSHHVLHDYAMARLLLRGPTRSVVERLKDADFSLFARPSIVIHFQHLWADDAPSTNRDTFWEQSLALLKSGGASRLANLVPPTIAAEQFTAQRDLDPLCDILSKAPPAPPAAKFLDHVVGAVITNSTPLVGADAAPWSGVVRRLAEALSRPIVFSVRTLVLLAIESKASPTQQQLADLGTASRLLFSFVFLEAPDSPGIPPVAIQGVCRTFDSSPDESEKLIRLLITNEHLSARGYLDLPWLAREVDHLIRSSPRLARDVYVAAFAHVEDSVAPTPMGGSRILAMSSNPKQDYDSGLWSLGEAFPEFLVVSLADATHVVVAAIRSYVNQRHRHIGDGGAESSTFTILGSTAPLATDISEIWDSGDVYSHDNAVRLLDAWDRRLRELNSAGDLASLTSVLTILVAEHASAVFWRRLLTIATDGEPLLQLVAPLLSAPAVLTGTDTGYVAGELLGARFATLDKATRQAVEQAIVSLPSGREDEGEQRYAERQRARLLGCLDEDALVTDEAKLVLSELRAADAVPDNNPRFRSEWITGRDSEEDHLTDMGVSLKVPENVALVALTKPVREFSDRFLNSKPDAADVKDVAEPVARLYEALRNPPVEIAAESGTLKLWNFTWGRLASVCKSIVDEASFSCTSEFGTLVRTMLLDAAGNDEPTYHEDREKSFAQSPGWGTPAARIDAALGLLGLVEKGCADDVVFETLERLTHDPVAAVRFQIATHLLVFMQTKETLLWNIAEAMVADEPNRGVLVGLVHSLSYLAGRYPDRIANLFVSLRARTSSGGTPDQLQQNVLQLLAQLYVYRDHSTARQQVALLLDQLGDDPRSVHPILHGLRGSLTDDAPEVRKRGFDLFRQILERATASFKAILETLSAENRETAEGLAELIRGVSDQVYFASGAFNERRSKRKSQPEKRDEDEEDVDAERFYHDASALLDALAEVELAPAAHHVIETLAFFAPIDPRGVFLRIARCVKASKAGGYQYESLAATLVVRIVEQYLAEHRYLFRDDPDCRAALLELLDAFVEAGWPTARRLIYRLDEIFR